jgi:hypothetical protein
LPAKSRDKQREYIISYFFPAVPEISSFALLSARFLMATGFSSTLMMEEVVSSETLFNF